MQMENRKKAFPLSLASLILGLLNSGINLPWAAVILLRGSADAHGGIGLFPDSELMNFFGSLSFFMSVTAAALIFFVLSVVFLIRIRKRNPGKKEKGLAAAGLLLNVLGLLANWVYFSAWAQYGGA